MGYISDYCFVLFVPCSTGCPFKLKLLISGKIFVFLTLEVAYLFHMETEYILVDIALGVIINSCKMSHSR